LRRRNVRTCSGVRFVAEKGGEGRELYDLRGVWGPYSAIRGAPAKTRYKEVGSLGRYRVTGSGEGNHVKKKGDRRDAVTQEPGGPAG